MKKILTPLLLFSFAVTGFSQQLDGFFKSSVQAQKELEEKFLQAVKPERFKIHLQELTKNPHITGTPENEEVAAYMAKIMREAGMEVTLYPYDVYLPNNPGKSLIEIKSPEIITLTQQEGPVPGDDYASDPRLHKGFNAFSGSADVTAQVVYVNFGVKADYEKLEELGVELTGKIAIARYGGNFRGYKAKFAEQYGAAGLIIYTDPKDNGYSRGDVYPDGPYYNETTIQRGSLLTMPFTGDPLTPFKPALPRDGDKKVKRKDPSEMPFHTIPVSPIGYGAAKEILSRMTGKVAPEAWQGGLDFEYKVEGGEELEVRLMVDQPIDFIRANNVVGKFTGTTNPDEWIILGCHYDAWSFGATDPNSGTAMLLTLSEALGDLIDNGGELKRSVMIAHWDAEEHGVIGSTEWVEQFKKELGANAVTYMNFDAAVSGKNFNASSAPTMKKVITEATKAVQYPGEGKTVYEVWKGANDEPSMGNLGGGSDHIAFYMHVGVPSLGAGAGGPTLYHSNYDNFSFYEKFSDPEFKMGGMVAQVAGIMSLRLSNAEVIPYDIPRYATDLKSHVESSELVVKRVAEDFGKFDQVHAEIESLESKSEKFQSALNSALESGSLSSKEIGKLNKGLLALEKSWIDPKGMDFGTWYKSLYVSTDPFSGYASWILPGIRYEVETNNPGSLEEWDKKYADVIQDLGKKIDKLTAILD
ncbi:M28 family peptidase [Algoriphagus sediminis]|uniref:M28 family peptidase n=1 Tax=Algoriphagus sediminis TaxID=3057113 RepID=A0ABT7YDF2_9BACT|nr:M28 family peptidase [Algoriphagus sediminis]MDN3204560.1 M28 family peptidase [Algoriphagus sediminis]